MNICDGCGAIINSANYVKLTKGLEYEGYFEYCKKCYEKIKKMLIDNKTSTIKSIVFTENKI